jgi:hypothetical protein
MVSGENTAIFNISLKSSSTGLSGTQTPSPLNLYPNPTSDRLIISSPVVITNLELCNAAGSLVYTAYDLDTMEVRLELGHLGTGIYFCRIETAKGIFVHKIVKQ